MRGLKEKIGEMFVVGFYGTDPAAARELIQRHHAGGIILFSRNIESASQLQCMCAELQEFRRQVSDSPLFIAIDQEGGCVARITEDVTVFPGNMALGAIGSEEIAAKVAETTASELLSLGLNVNFAPVLDLGTNPRNPGVGARSFSSDHEVAARLGEAMIEGMQAKGVHAAAKHFPGLGEAMVDSHDELPRIDIPAGEMENRELPPFKAAIHAGVSFIMTAHCSYPSLDDTCAPATLSAPILKGLLRGQMGFEGIIITDCLEMAAVEKRLASAQSVIEAALAGADMLLICHTLEKQLSAIESLEHAVKAGNMPVEAIDESEKRILSVKKRTGLAGQAPYKEIKIRDSFSEAIAMDAVTVVRNEGSLLPLRMAPAEKLAVVVPAFDALTKVEEAAEPHGVLLDELKGRHQSIDYRKVSVKPDYSETRECVKIGNEADILLILTYNLHQYREQRELVSELLESGKPAVVAAVRDPYDLAFVPTARACVATYGFRSCSLKALVKILFGEAEAKGRLPVAFD